MDKTVLEIAIMNGRLMIFLTGIILVGCGKGFWAKFLGFIFMLAVILTPNP